MEERYTVGEVARLLGKDRKTIERWASRASIQPGQDTQDARTRIFSKEQVKTLAHLHHVSLAEEKPKPTPVQPSADRLAALEQKLRRHYDAQLAALEARLTALETQSAASAPQTRSAARQPVSPAQPSQRPPPASTPPPAAAQRATAPPADPPATLANRYQAIGFLTQHGANYSVVNGWRVLPPMRADALRYALERGQRLRMCGEEGCVCRDVLE